MTVSDIRRFVCIHGHFYQPPRENPWLEVVEAQDSAAPYHDWNARVNAECYAPNARARLLNEQQRITAVVNNFAHVSFDVGPTLMNWLAGADPGTYRAIQQADRDSQRRFGRGNAIAQAYGHAILPLADARDRVTHVRWGIRDFEHRFGRRPVGMWLPETAVDNATLRVLAEHDIRFTILAPHQAGRIRRAGANSWESLSGGRIDTRRAYRWRRGAAQLALFFYDHELAQQVAFGGLLNDGGVFVERLLGAFGSDSPAPELVHLATDGESYGHHHRFGEMALAYALARLQADPSVRLTNYAAFLDLAPPNDDVEIVERTSWSCTHGVERWRANCGCNSGAHPGWRQDWRKPLRESLAWLKDQLDRLFEQAQPKLLADPWAARDAYIDVLLDNSQERREAFLAEQARPNLTAAERVHVWKLLEMQRSALLMFTSCGWFFDDLGGIETTQVVRYACRAAQLAGELGAPVEPDLLARLEAAHGNLPGRPNGREIYRQLVAPTAVSLPRAAAHAVIASLFELQGELPRHAYTYRFETIERAHSGTANTVMVVGGLQVRSDVTEQLAAYAYAALYLGGHDVHCAIGGAGVLEQLPRLHRQLADIFTREPLSAVVRAIDAAFGPDGFSLRDLFHPERRAILDRIGAQAIRPLLGEMTRTFDQHRRMLDFLRDVDVPIPEGLRELARIVLQQRLAVALRELRDGHAPLERVAELWRDAGRWQAALQLPPLQAGIERGLTRVLGTASADPTAHVARALALLDAAAMFAVTPNLWMAQNAFYDFLSTPAAAALTPETTAALLQLAERLGFAVDRQSLAPLTEATVI
jgi:alpha-amylase/alpha-mannosidase (GH57 family)